MCCQVPASGICIKKKKPGKKMFQIKVCLWYWSKSGKLTFACVVSPRSTRTLYNKGIHFIAIKKSKLNFVELTTNIRYTLASLGINFQGHFSDCLHMKPNFSAIDSSVVNMFL